MAKRKFLTVGELKKVLATYDDDLIPVVLDEGKGHYNPIEKYDVELKLHAYFPDSDIEFPKDTMYLQIGWT